MTNRERIINTALCKRVDRLPFFFYFPPWTETEKRWRSEGLGHEEPWDRRFGFDPGCVLVDVNVGYCPAFEHTQVEDLGETEIVRDRSGILKEQRKDGGSIPKFLEYPIKNRADWEKIRSDKLNPDDPARFPDNWDTLVDTYNKSDQAVQVGCYPYGLFGTLRDMIGVEDFLLSFYDQPELIHDIMDYLTDFWISIYHKICARVKVDCIHIWEDLSGKNGSLISNTMIREFMLPNYRKIRAFADEHDIPIVALDTDGDCMKLVPVFIEGGINMMMPFEVAAGSDVLYYRREYPDFSIMGGIDKQEIAKGQTEIDLELDRIAPILHGTGYFPALDHLPHPDISWQDFCYFVERLKNMIGV